MGLRTFTIILTVLLYAALAMPAFAQQVEGPTGEAQRAIESTEQPRSFRPPREPVSLPEPEIQVPEGEEVAVDDLRGVRFVSSDEEIFTEPDDPRWDDYEAIGIDTRDVELIDTAEFRGRIQPFLGKPASFKTFGEIAKQTILYYRSRNRPVVDVYVPPQTIPNPGNPGAGVVQLIVLEGRVGKVTVEGNNYFSDELIREKVRLRPGDHINSRKLLDDINFINDNPFRYVRPVFSPGEESGTTDLTLQTQDRRPIRFYAGYEDTGSRLTRLDRYLVGVNFGNLWGRGHEAGFQAASNHRLQEIGIYSAYYRIPLGNKQTFAVFGNYANFNAKHEGIHLDGQSWQVSPRYIIQLPSFKQLTHEVQFGFDFKRNDNNLLFGGVEVYDNTVDTTQWMGQYSGAIDDALGRTSFRLRGFWSPCPLSSKADKSDYDKARVGTEPQYFYSNLAAERIWDLPYGFTFYNRFIGQLSTERLLGSEQLGFGGYNTIRGFDEREWNADEGLMFTLELRTPQISLGQINNNPELAQNLQFLVFWDHGEARQVSRYPGDNKHATLSSVGVGMRYNLGTYANVRVDYGHRLEEPGGTGFNDQGRFHIGVMVAY